MPRRVSPDLLQLLWEASHAILAMSRHMERNIGITGPQRLVLRAVAAQPGISLGDLAEALGVHPSTVTGLVDRLVYRELLARDRRTDDRRSSVLRTTPAGQNLLDSSGLTIEAVVQTATAQMPSADLHAAARVLHAISSALRNASGDPPPTESSGEAAQ